MDVSNIWGKCWLNHGADVHSNYFKEQPMERIMDTKRVCICCGTNNSIIWWKCCPKHTTEQGPDICCQRCAENLHSKEFLGIESIQIKYSSRDISDLVARLREAADPTATYIDTPWWWDSPDRGGPAQLLREAANAIEETVAKELAQPEKDINSDNIPETNINFSIYILMKVVQDHENHLFPKDLDRLTEAIESLKNLRTDGFI